MSHFCLSRADDSIAHAAALSGAAEAAAFVWGGASGLERGQLLDLWCQKGQVRITPEDKAAPANWIVSYKIPRLHIGQTFVGVKPGTTIRETQNAIRIGLETAKEARERCQRFPSQNVPVTTPGRPTGITPDLWLRLLNFTKQFEGITDFLYNDRSTPQLVTCGVGKLVKDVGAAIALKRSFVNPSGGEPSEDEMRDDYAAASAMKRDDPPGNLFDFATVTVLRMPWPKITELLGTAMGERVNTMLRMADFADFATFPADAQLACASIAYGSWQYAIQAPLRAAVRARNWADAAKDYRSPGWDAQKDAAHVRLFRSAAGL
jgi:GH24 family phage-related lysozyme (muramidase)